MSYSARPELHAASARVHQPAIGPTKRTISQNMIRQPIPIHAPQVVICMNCLLCQRTMGIRLRALGDLLLDFGCRDGRPRLARRRASPMASVDQAISC